MRAEVQAEWDRVEADREAMIAYVLGLSEGDRHTTHAPKAFTPAQTLGHMAMVEEFYLPIMRKLASDGQPRRPSRPNFLYRWVLKACQKPKPIPTTASFTPPGDRPDARALADQWRSVRHQIAELMSDAGPTDTVLKHPLFGRMGPIDIIALFREHQRYHMMRMGMTVPT